MMTDYEIDSPSPHETLLTLTAQGVGLNLSGLLLLASAGAILGPLGWTSSLVALLLKLIGDSQLVRAYWLWQKKYSSGGITA